MKLFSKLSKILLLSTLMFLLFAAATSISFANACSYCAASTAVQDEYIGRVTVGSIDNATGFQSGVADYTAMSTIMKATKTYSITVINGGPSYGGDAVYVSIDWNSDCDLTDAGEQTQLTTSDYHTFTGTISAPLTLTPGTTRMRVRMVYYGGSNPCGGQTYGEVEDYTVVAVPPAPDAEITEIYRAGYNYTVPYHVGSYTTFAVLKNNGLLPLTSVDLTLTTLNTGVDPQTQVLNWSGSLVENASATVTFPNPTSYSVIGPDWFNPQITVQGGASLNGGAYTDGTPAYLQRIFVPVRYDIDISNPYGLRPIGDGVTVPIVCRVFNYGARPMDPDQGWGIEINSAIDGVPLASWIQPSALKIQPGTFADITIGTGTFPAKSPMAPYYITASASFTNPAVTDYDMLNNFSNLSQAPKLMEGTTYTVGGPLSSFPDFETAINYLNGGGIFGTIGLPVIFEVRNLGAPYTGSFSLGAYSNVSNSPVIIRPAPGEVVTLQHTLPGAGWYLGDLSGASNITFEDINFQVFEAPSNVWGRMFNLSNCDNIVFDGCSFTGVQTAITDPTHAVIYLDQADNITFTGNHIYYGSYNVYENISNICRTLDFQGNYFLGASNIGASLAFDGFQDCGGVNFTGNTISNYNGTNPIGGLHTWNSTVVSNNVFSGIAGTDNGQAALEIIHTFPYFYITTSSLQVSGNTFNNLTDVDGIHLFDVTNGIVNQNNNITITNTSEWYDGCGILISNPNTGQRETGKAKRTDGSTLAASSFGITVDNNVITMLDMDMGYGILLDNTSDVAVTKNLLHIYNLPGDGGFGLNGLAAINGTQSSVFATNMVDGQDLVGIYEANSWDMGVYYNTISVNSNTIDNEYAVAVIDGGQIQLYRNILQNAGYGKVIRIKNQPVYEANQNNFWNTATPSLGGFIGRFYDTDVQIVYTLGLLDSSSTMLNWRYYTTPNDEETYFTGRAYYSSSNLHLAEFKEDMVSSDALFAQVPNPTWPYTPPTLPFVIAENPLYYSLFENFDIDLENRASSGFFVGADNLHPGLSIVAQPENLNECLGSANTDLRVSAFLTLGVPIHYQWWKDDVPMTDVDNPNFDKSILFFGPLDYANAGVYRCQVFGFGQDVLWTDYVTINILAPVEITRGPVDKFAEAGASLMFEVEAHAFGLLDDPPMFSPRYEWWKIDQNNVYTQIANSKKYSGALSSILGIKDIDDNDYNFSYYAKVFSECNSDSSAKFMLLRVPEVVINTQPQGMTGCEGADAQLTVDATVTEGGTGLAYQWKHNGLGIGDNANYAGTETNTLSISNLTPALAGDYTCEITALPTTKKVTTNVAAVTVNVPPTITTQPVAVIVTENQPVNLSITATGTDPLTYQWYKGVTPISGATSSAYSIASASKADEDDYYCVVTNDCDNIRSDVVTVKVNTDMTGVDDNFEGFSLLQNSPNPFSLTSTIGIVIPRSSVVRLTLTDIFGREIAVLLNKTLDEGTTEVKVNTNELKLTSGVYYYTLTTGAYSETKQMVIVK